MTPTWEMGEEPSNLVTANHVKAGLARTGKSAADLARELGVAKHVLYRVLAGSGKNLRGESHRVAVLLGIKDGEIVQ